MTQMLAMMMMMILIIIDVDVDVDDGDDCDGGDDGDGGDAGDDDDCGDDAMFLDVAGYDSLLVAEVPPIPPQPRSSRSRLINYRGQNGAMDSLSCKLPSKFGFPR